MLMGDREQRVYSRAFRLQHLRFLPGFLRAREERTIEQHKAKVASQSVKKRKERKEKR
jgi:hypothetical protein